MWDCVAVFLCRFNLCDGLVKARRETLRVLDYTRNILVLGQDVTILFLALAFTLEPYDRTFRVENGVGLIPMLLRALGE